MENNELALPDTLEKVVKTALRRAIVTGKYLSGQEIDELEFAKRMRVSRMPVRSAVAALEVEGLIRKVPRRGSFVVELTEEDVEEAYSLRTLIENNALITASERCNEEDLEAIKKIVVKLKESYRSIQDFLSDNILLHHLLIKPSKWKRHIQYSYQLRNVFQIFLVNFDGYSIFDMEKSIEDHKKIYEAYVNKNDVDLLRLNEEHILIAKQRVLKSLKENKAQTRN